MEKLIRDKIVNHFNEEGFTDYRYVEIGSDEHKEFLIKKLQEELDELKETDYKDTEEWADVFEVMMEMVKQFSDFEEFEKAKYNKGARLGAFKNGLVMKVK